ncbi:hypothetical protein HZH68_009843 [Vespula germanica]|uniref:Uncharacterized protein n=1 Tax=Vespula germanica TaxID=30212 RepID=A0A834N666_VESGE|nr:hypothetical protein HZH68_009843 [Vespula germanica]
MGPPISFDALIFISSSDINAHRAAARGNTKRGREPLAVSQPSEMRNRGVRVPTKRFDVLQVRSFRGFPIEYSSLNSLGTSTSRLELC